MKLGIMQPYFFPYLGYWQLIHAVDTFIILDDVNFIKKGWIHRNNILVNGKASPFNLNISKVSQNKTIRDHELAGDNKWKHKLLNTLKHQYKKAPHFQETYALVTQIIENDESNLSKFLGNSIIKICDYLNIDTKIIRSSSIYPKQELRGQDRIIDICKKEHATDYINPIGGLELYNPAYFEQNKLKLNFIKMQPITYPQLIESFVPHLSIIDVLMFNDIEQSQVLLDKSKMIQP